MTDTTLITSLVTARPAVPREPAQDDMSPEDERPCIGHGLDSESTSDGKPVFSKITSDEPPVFSRITSTTSEDTGLWPPNTSRSSSTESSDDSSLAASTAFTDFPPTSTTSTGDTGSPATPTDTRIAEPSDGATRPPAEQDELTNGATAGIVIGIVVALLAAIFLGRHMYKKRKNRFQVLGWSRGLRSEQSLDTAPRQGTMVHQPAAGGAGSASRAVTRDMELRSIRL